MNNDDQILRAYAAITSIRANVPERHEVEERWVNEFNVAIEKLENSLDIDLQEFKVPQDALKRFVASCNSLTNDVTYLEGLWCERAILMQKLDSVLMYFTGCKTGKTIRSVSSIQIAGQAGTGLMRHAGPAPARAARLSVISRQS